MFLPRKKDCSKYSLKELNLWPDSKTNALPGQRDGAAKCGHVSEPWAQGLECAGSKATGPVGAFGRVKTTGLEHEDCVLKRREIQEHRSPHFEAAQEEEGQAQLT